jgi:hypothetical protein
MQKTAITMDILAVLLGETDNGSGAPIRRAGHIEDRLASIGGDVKPARRRRTRRRLSA